MKKIFKEQLVELIKANNLTVVENEVIKAMVKLYHQKKTETGSGNAWLLEDLPIALDYYKGSYKEKIQEIISEKEPEIKEVIIPPIVKVMKKNTKEDNGVKIKMTANEQVEKGSSFRIGKKSYIVLWGEDKHNIQLQSLAGDIRFVCIDKHCPDYSFHEHKVEIDY